MGQSAAARSGSQEFLAATAAAAAPTAAWEYSGGGRGGKPEDGAGEGRPRTAWDADDAFFFPWPAMKAEQDVESVAAEGFRDFGTEMAEVS